MADEIGAGFTCTNEPPHRFALGECARLDNGVLVTLTRLDRPYPPRQIFITSREMKMGYDDVFKACYVCVDQGKKENAIGLPKAEIEASLPPASARSGG